MGHDLYGQPAGRFQREPAKKSDRIIGTPADLVKIDWRQGLHADYRVRTIVNNGQAIAAIGSGRAEG